MPIELPKTVKTDGAQTLVVLSTKPANLAAVTLAQITAGKKITCHVSGKWWAEATTEAVTPSKKLCQTNVTPRKGNTTHTLPELTYTYDPQGVGTSNAEGNEAYEVLAKDSIVYVLHRIGIADDVAWAAGQKYRLFPIECGYQSPTETQDDAGAEAAIKQQLFIAPGYDEPINGVVTAPA